MTKIICGVLTCYLNKDKQCCAESIDVSGRDAKSRGATACRTFGNKRHEGLSSSTQSPRSESYVSCTATTCLHNKDEKCYSQTIQIHGTSADKAMETFCTTYHKK